MLKNLETSVYEAIKVSKHLQLAKRKATPLLVHEKADIFFLNMKTK